MSKEILLVERRVGRCSNVAQEVRSREEPQKVEIQLERSISLFQRNSVIKTKQANKPPYGLASAYVIC